MHGVQSHAGAGFIHLPSVCLCFATSGRAELLGETDVDQVLDSSPPNSQSLRDKDLPRTKSGTHSCTPCPASVPGEDDLALSQRSGVTEYEERAAEDEIEEFEDDW